MPARAAVQIQGCRNRRLGPDPLRRHAGLPSLPRVTTSPPLAQGLDRAGPSSCHAVQLNLSLIDGGGCVAESLLEIFLFEERVLAEKLFPVAVDSQDFQDPAHGDPHAADTWFAAALARFHGNAIKIGRAHV